MSAARQVHDPVREALARQGRLLDDLERALDAEARALRERDPEALERWAREKADLVEALERTHARLRAHLRAPADAAGIRDALASADPDGALRAEWERQRRRLSDLRARNRANGGLIALSRRTAEQALAILRGGCGGAPTYGPGGERQAAGPGRTLGRT